MKDWCAKHYVVTRLIIGWALCLATVVTLKVFFDPVEIPGSTAAAYATFVGLPGITAISVWVKNNVPKFSKRKE